MVGCSCRRSTPGLRFSNEEGSRARENERREREPEVERNTEETRKGTLVELGGFFFFVLGIPVGPSSCGRLPPRSC